MRLIGRLVLVLIGGFVVAGIAAAVAAQSAKRRIVPTRDPAADDVTLAAIFEPIDFRSTATSFRGGTLDCWFGGGVIDLRGATLDPGGAHLQVKTIFGGGQIIVPDDWRVDLDLTAIAGGAGDARPAQHRPADAPHLQISGMAAFGGLGITSTISDENAAAIADAVAKRGAATETDRVEPDTLMAEASETTMEASPAV